MARPRKKKAGPQSYSWEPRGKYDYEKNWVSSWPDEGALLDELFGLTWEQKREKNTKDRRKAKQTAKGRATASPKSKKSKKKVAKRLRAILGHFPEGEGYSDWVDGQWEKHNIDDPHIRDTRAERGKVTKLDTIEHRRPGSVGRRRRKNAKGQLEAFKKTATKKTATKKTATKAAKAKPAVFKAAKAKPSAFKQAARALGRVGSKVARSYGSPVVMAAELSWDMGSSMVESHRKSGKRTPLQRVRASKHRAAKAGKPRYGSFDAALKADRGSQALKAPKATRVKVGDNWWNF